MSETAEHPALSALLVAMDKDEGVGVENQRSFANVSVPGIQSLAGTYRVMLLEDSIKVV